MLLLPESTWLEQAKAQVHARITEIFDTYPNLKVAYALFSGGDDSTVLAWLAMQHPRVKGVIFANTLTGDKETVQYVRETAKAQGWEYHETKPAVSDRLPAMIAARGIMGPAMHPIAFNNLKGKPWDKLRGKLATQHKCARKDVLFLTGVRRQESTKRARTVNLIKMYESKTGKLKSVWGAPLYDWTREDLERFFGLDKLPRNMHAYAFGASRECGCKTAEGVQDAIIEQQKFPVYWERRKLQYELARAAYALQEFELEHGLIDPEDATIPRYGVPDADGMFQMELFDYRYESPDSVNGTPFVCVGCDNITGKIDASTFDRIMKNDDESQEGAA